MTDQQTNEKTEVTTPDDAELTSAAKKGKGARRTSWRAITLAVLFFAAMLCLSFTCLSGYGDGVKQRFAAAQAARDKQAAYYDVILNRVAVNGERGTPEWREYYRQALERVLSTHDFSDFCTYNGFLKDSAKVGVLPCIAVGEVRAVRSSDGTISYFRENDSLHTVANLNVLEQDVHADDYLDIDVFEKALDNRAIDIASDERTRKNTAALDAKVREDQRAFAEALKLVTPIQIRPPVVIGRSDAFEDDRPAPELEGR
jgi:hypothetical protein